MKAVMQDMIRSFVTGYGFILKTSPTHSQSQSITVDNETPQVIDHLSEGELPEWGVSRVRDS